METTLKQKKSGAHVIHTNKRILPLIPESGDSSRWQKRNNIEADLKRALSSVEGVEYVGIHTYHIIVEAAGVYFDQEEVAKNVLTKFKEWWSLNMDI